MRLVLASRNAGKLRELRDLLAGMPVAVEAWEGELPPEDGATLEENARGKARAVAAATGAAAVGDDTGLEVEALGGAPGVLSARFAGPACDPAANIAKLLAALAGVPRERRGARFRTVLCLCAPGRPDAVCEGTLAGEIADVRRGAGGFGYDPLFLVPDVGRTLAEMAPAEKNAISHRGRAVRALRREIEKWLAGT